MGKKFALIGAVAMLLASLASSADDYQYIITPGYDPNAASLAYSSSSASLGTAFVTATRAVPSAGQPIEARYRTWDESDGIPFRSDKVWGFNIFIR